MCIICITLHMHNDKFFRVCVPYMHNRPSICESILRLLIIKCNLTDFPSGEKFYMCVKKVIISLTRGKNVTD